MSIGTVAGLVFTYAFSSLAIFLSTARWLRTSEEEAPRLFFLTLGTGPVAVSWLLTRSCQFFPGRSDLFHVVGVGACFGVLFLVGTPKLRLFLALWARLRQYLSALDAPGRWPARLIVAAVACMLLFVLLQSLCIPLKDNDPLQYAKLSQLFHRHNTIPALPFAEADPETGFYWPSSHPVGYPSLILWSYMIQGSDASPGTMRLIAPAFTTYTLLLLWHLLSGRGYVSGPAAMLLLLATPLAFLLTAVSHVDPLRVYTFFLAFAWLAEALRRPTVPVLVLSGLVVGLSMFSHAIGLITLPIFVFIYFIKSREPFFGRVRQLGLVVLAALVLGGPRYFQNCLAYGAPVGDTCQVWELPKLRYTDYLRHQRQLATARDRLVNGALSPFVRPRLFGFSYWLLPVALVCTYRSNRRDLLSSVVLWVILSFFALVAVSLAAGTDLIIKNFRYFFTVQPFVVYFGGLFFGTVYEKFVGE